jgi:hypothetical protein
MTRHRFNGTRLKAVFPGRFQVHQEIEHLLLGQGLELLAADQDVPGQSHVQVFPPLRPPPVIGLPTGQVAQNPVRFLDLLESLCGGLFGPAIGMKPAD